MDVRMLEEDFHDGVVVNGPDFEIRGNVGEVAGFDEVDLVRSIFMIAARAGERNGRWVDMAFLFIRFDFSSQIQASRRSFEASACKRGRFSFTFPVTEALPGIWAEPGVTTE